MYLKALEIQGFKSFPDKTRLTFEKDITAIVGPNGSGKSNISDAILWVMGEQRTKALRGGKMEDVVFGGTEKRPKMGFAQASLIIDNTQRIFDTDSSEVMITRRYYRNGESEYYINRESVRLRDVNELLMDTGLGRNGYSIIGQGKISEVVSAKTGDRRELFEEAAGISKYRYRKDESERKLSHTDENLVRINDKIEELKIQVDPLREQAEIAKKYLVLRDELRFLEVSVWMETLDKLHERAKTIFTDWENAQADLRKAKQELADLYANIESYSEKMREKDVDAEKLRLGLSEKEAAIAETDSALAVLRNSKQHNEERKNQLLSEIDEQGTRAKALENQIAMRYGRVDEIKHEIEKIDHELSEISDGISENAVGIVDTKREMSKLVSSINDRQVDLSHCNTVLSMLEDASDEKDESIKKREAELENTIETKNVFEENLKKAQNEKNEAFEKVNSLKNVILGYNMRIEGKEKKVKALEGEKTKLTIDLNSMNSRVNMLSEMEREYEGYSKSVKTVMRESKKGSLRGIYGPVANLVKTESKYTLAIETALGGAMQSIVVESQQQGKAAIEMLKNRQAGRATFLPVDTIRGRELNYKPSNEPGYCGTALELANFDNKFYNIFSNLLGRTVVAETLSDAVSMSKRNKNQLRIVTLDGQLINAGGSMTGGSAMRNAGILSRANELKTLVAKRDKLFARSDTIKNDLAEATREYTASKYELDTANEELHTAEITLRECEGNVSHISYLLSETEKNIETLRTDAENEAVRFEESEKRKVITEGKIKKLNSEIDELTKQLESLTNADTENEKRSQELTEKLSQISEKRSSLITESDTTIEAIEQLKVLYNDISKDGDTRQQSIEKLDSEVSQIDKQISDYESKLTDVKGKAENIRSELSEINNEKLKIEGLRNQSNKKAQDKNTELLDCERLCGSIEQKKVASEMEEKQIIDKLWDNYELSRTAAQNVRHPVENLSASTKKITTLKREITKLGNPNIGAIDEYERVSERYSFLTEQRDDVEKAKKELEKIISEITKEMKEIFENEFKIIDESFRKTFLELFGGGRASLVLEDKDDVLNCGIEIKVQPPGKSLSTLSLLSGGEKAFVAIALYFAIIKVRPTPFCVMDEIEAALDEANVIRYASYMRKLTDNTQFITITHRRGTMEEADMLYGVTMQEKGVSQVISVDLQEAEKSIEK